MPFVRLSLMSCRVSGCARAATSRWSRYCSAHKSRARRHGHPDQVGIRKRDLQDYLAFIQGFRDRNPESAAWGLLEGRWRALEADCRAYEAAYLRGRPGSRHQLQAAREVIRLGASAPASVIIDTAIAMVMLEQSEPSRFRSDGGFLHQMVRMVRATADVSAGSRYDHRAGRVRRVYRELSPRTAVVLGGWLRETFGPAGLQLHGKRMELLARERSEAVALRDALGELA
jgi:hypothetical protein